MFLFYCFINEEYKTVFWYEKHNLGLCLLYEPFQIPTDPLQVNLR